MMPQGRRHPFTHPDSDAARTPVPIQAHQARAAVVVTVAATTARLRAERRLGERGQTPAQTAICQCTSKALCRLTRYSGLSFLADEVFDEPRLPEHSDTPLGAREAGAVDQLTIQ